VNHVALPASSKGTDHAPSISVLVRAVECRLGTDAWSMFLVDGSAASVSRAEIMHTSECSEKGPTKPASGAGAEAAVAGDIRGILNELDRAAGDTWTTCRSLPAHIVARSLMHLASTAERVSFAALRLEPAQTLGAPTSATFSDLAVDESAAVCMVHSSSYSLSRTIQLLLASSDSGSAVSVCFPGQAVTAYDSIRRVVAPQDFTADATVDVKAHVGAVQRGCATLARVLGNAEKWERCFGAAGARAVRAAGEAVGTLVGALATRILPRWLHDAVEASLNGPAGDLNDNDLGLEVGLSRTDGIS